MTVLWHAAAGGVGLLACQWLRALGVTVIGTVGSAAKAELAARARLRPRDRLPSRGLRRARARADRRRRRAGGLRLGRQATRLGASIACARAACSRCSATRRQGRAVQSAAAVGQGLAVPHAPDPVHLHRRAPRAARQRRRAVRRNRRRQRAHRRAPALGGWPRSPRPTVRWRVARRWARQSWCRSSGAARSTAVAVAEPPPRAEHEPREAGRPGRKMPAPSQG